jgi:signal transduction histidine kinase
LEEVREATGAEACSVALIDKVSGDLVFRQAVGAAVHDVIGLRLPLGEGLAGWVAQHRQSVLVSDASVDARVRILADRSGFVTRDLIGVPLIARGQVTGVIELVNKRSGIFDEDDRRLLESVAAQAAIAIENAHLLENTQQALKEVNALYRINQGLVVSLDPQELLQDTVDLLQINFDYHHVQVYVVEPGTGDLIMRAGSGEIGMKLKEKKHRLHAGGGIVGYTAEMGTPFFTNDVDKVHFFIRNPLLPNTKSELAVPVKIEGRILGVLDIQQVPPGYLTHHDIQLVCAVADQLAIALQKANLYSDLQASLKMEQAMRLQMVQSERLTVMGRLLASVSHELNNPLQAIQNALFLLREETGISAQGKQDLDIVLSESERMSALINRLRANYRSPQAEDFQPTQINTIIEDVYALIATHLRHNEIAFEFQPDPELPEIPGLADQIRQVLLNLLMNAVEAMTTGGRLIVSTQHLAESHEMLIKVSDTGAGIHPAILPNIFDAFVTNKEHGTGLGLTITYDIITKHRGHIQAENNPHGGATFSVWLPCGDEASE